jgi:hypothetical protein
MFLGLSLVCTLYILEPKPSSFIAKFWCNINLLNVYCQFVSLETDWQIFSMKKGKIYLAIFLISFCVFHKESKAQFDHELLFGFNASYFKDWNEKPIRFFNPEISYRSPYKANSELYMSISGFYGEGTGKDIIKTGDIFQRLIFCYNIGLERRINNFSFGLGPSFRYRREKKLVFIPQPGFQDALIDPRRSHFDVGGFANIQYKLPLNKSRLFDLKLTYCLYSKGVNPASLGIFYGWRF